MTSTSPTTRERPPIPHEDHPALWSLPRLVAAITQIDLEVMRLHEIRRTGTELEGAAAMDLLVVVEDRKAVLSFERHLRYSNVW